MATVKVKNIARAQSATREQLDKVRKDPAFLVQVADFTKEQVLGFTRAGKSLETGSAFPGLSEKWIEQRDELAKRNATDGFFLGSRKSNLTFTGQLLKSIKAKIFPGDASVKIFAEGTHRGYKTAGGRTKSVKVEKIFEGQAAMGRGVFDFSEKFRTQLRRRASVLFKRVLRSRIKSL